jgi:hypothetical protein
MSKGLPPRLRFLLWMLWTGIVGWLAVVGLVAIINGRADVPDLLIVAAFVVGTTLAVLTRAVPARFQVRDD